MGRLWCLLLALAASASGEVLNLRCLQNPQTITVSDSLTVAYPGDNNKYPNESHCHWIFQSDKPAILVLTFDKFQVQEDCNDYATINNGSKICEMNEKVYPGIQIELEFRSDLSRTSYGFKATIRRVIPLCRFGDEKARDSLSVFTLLNTSGGNPTRGTNFIGQERSLVTSAEIIAPDSRGWQLCLGNSTIFPESEIPSCHASFPATCEWHTTAPTVTLDVKPNYFFADKEFQSDNMTFTTKRLIPALGRICLKLVYYTDAPYGSVKLYAVSAEEKHLVAISELVKGAEHNVLKLSYSVPESIRGMNLNLILEINATENVRVLYIQGCSRLYEKNRYLIYGKPAAHSNSDHEGTTLDGNLKGQEAHQNLKIEPLIVGYRWSIKLLEDRGSCVNGGLMSNKNECICPAGFTGPNCEKGCGPNRLGRDCDVQCSFTERECKAMIICQHPMGCYCAPGWKGDNCNYLCGDGEYGAGCSEDCGHCNNGAPCDIYTGECFHGCAPGFLPPLCKSRLPYLNTTLKVVKKNETSVTLDMRYKDGDIVGELDRGKFYKIQYTAMMSEGLPIHWNETDTQPLPSDKYIHKTITDLRAGWPYEARIILLDEQLYSYQGPELPTVRFDTCSDDDIKLNITLKERGEDYLELAWEGISRDMTQCKFYEYDVQILKGSTWTRYLSTRPEFKFDSLLPDQMYDFKVGAVSKPNQRYYLVSFTTKPNVTGIVRNLKATSVDKTSVHLVWNGQNKTNQEFLVTYQCLQVLLNPLLNCSKETGTFRTTTSSVQLNELRPFTRYLFRVSELPGDKYSRRVYTTKLFVNDPKIELADVSSTKSTIDVKWSLNCEICQLFVGGYFVKLEFQESTDGVQSAGKSLTFVDVNNFSFRGLHPGTTFKLTVYLSDKSRNNISSPFTAVVHTKPSVPTAVRDLTVYKVGRNLAGLRWSGPSQTYGDLESFVVSYAGKRSVHKPTRCPAWPHLYCHTVDGLAPETDYDISVSARNKNAAEDGDASQTSVKTVESGPEAPVDLAVRDVTESGATLTWRPPGMFNGIIRSFLGKIQHIESSNASDCCYYHPKFDVLFTTEQPLYEKQVPRLKSGSKYAVSLMAETVMLGPPATLSFSTRPEPPSAVILPSSVDLVLDHGSPPKRIVWPQTSHSQVQPFPTQRNLLILVPSGEAGPNPLAVDEDLLHLIRRKFGDSFHIVAEYEKSDALTLAVGNVTGSIQIPELSKGQDYKIWALTINTYCGLNNFRSVDSLPFKAE